MKKLSNMVLTALTAISVNAFAGDCPPLSGSFTIGSSENADFSTISQAVNALHCGGISSSVTFLVEDGTYNEKVVMSSIPGASAFNTITFESKSGNSSEVIIAHASGDAALVLNGTSFITFENMTIDHQGGTYGNTMRVDGKAANLRFKGMIFEGVSAQLLGPENATVHFTAAAAKSDVTFEDCEINNGSIGISKSGISAEQPDSKTVITGTLFFNQHEAGMALSNEDAPIISNNVISSLSTYPGYHGLHLQGADNHLVITNNIINAANGSIGIMLHDCIATATDLSTIENNSVAVGGTDKAIGIALSGSTDNQVLNFNRIKLTIVGEQAPNQAYYTNTGTGNNVNMMNNIFYDLTTGGYTIIGNTYKDLNNRLPKQSTAELSVSANGLMIEKVIPVR